MDWFKRYGIPGAYFCVLTLAWIAICYPCKFNFFKANIKDLVVLVVIAFLPIGYILTTIQMFIYYSIRGLGIHRSAQKEANLPLPPEIKTKIKGEHEAIFEAYTHVFSLNYAENNKKFEVVKFNQDWVRKRMDILTINATLILASLISAVLSILGLLCFSKCEPQFKIYCGIIIFSISVIVAVVCFKTYRMMRESIKIVLVDYFRRIKKYYDESKETIPS